MKKPHLGISDEQFRTARFTDCGSTRFTPSCSRREYSMRGSRTASRCCLSAWNPAQSPKSRSTPFAARVCSMSGSVRRSRLCAASAPRSTTLPESAVSGVFAFALSSSGPIAYSAAIRSPVTASRCSRSPALSSVTSSARSRARLIST